MQIGNTGKGAKARGRAVLGGGRATRLAGFTLLEIMITVAIIAVVGAIAVPSWLRARERAQNGRMVSDLRTFADQFTIFNSETSSWPDDAGPGRLPDRVGGTNTDALEGMIRRSNWETTPAIGGQFDWDYNPGTGLAAVAIANPTATLDQLRAMDEMMLDDGDLNTGFFRQVSGGVIYVVNE